MFLAAFFVFQSEKIAQVQKVKISSIGKVLKKNPIKLLIMKKINALYKNNEKNS